MKNWSVFIVVPEYLRASSIGDEYRKEMGIEGY